MSDQFVERASPIVATDRAVTGHAIDSSWNREVVKKANTAPRSSAISTSLKPISTYQKPGKLLGESAV